MYFCEGKLYAWLFKCVWKSIQMAATHLAVLTNIYNKKKIIIPLMSDERLILKLNFFIGLNTVSHSLWYTFWN